MAKININTTILENIRIPHIGSLHYYANTCLRKHKLGAVDNTRLASRLESHVYTHFAVLSGSIIYENAINCKKMYRCFGS